jgi:hypothetical protein
MEVRSAVNGITGYFADVTEAATISGPAHSPLACNNSQRATPGKYCYSTDPATITEANRELQHPTNRLGKAVQLQQLPPPAFVLLGIPR